MTDRFVPGPDFEDDHTGVLVRMRWDPQGKRWRIYTRAGHEHSIIIQTMFSGPKAGENAQKHATELFKLMVSAEVLRLERPGSK